MEELETELIKKL